MKTFKTLALMLALSAPLSVLAQKAMLCNFDKTVSWAELKNCHEFTTGQDNTPVTSFVITLVCPEGNDKNEQGYVLMEYNMTCSALSQEVLNQIEKRKPNKIFLEKIVAQVDGKPKELNPITLLLTY